MIPRRRRLHTVLLIAATVALVPAMIALNQAAKFPDWRMAVGWSPQALASTAAVPAHELASGLPTLSLVIDQGDLDDPARGILANVMEHGKDWERPASVSYFEGGRLRFATGVGVRVHGGGSRLTSERQGFRLYFRRKFGATQVPPGMLFGDDAQPIRRLVVHNDVRADRDGTKWHFANPLAYDIAEAVGGIAPDTQPVRFFLNGEYYGVFVLTERIDERYFEAHWGHGKVRVDQERFDELWAKVSATRPLTMARVAQEVDLENLTRWFIAVAFAGTRDAYQGPGQFEDRTREGAEWFWINWDMDQSFRNWDLDSYQYLLERINEGRKGRNRAEPRPTLLTNLIAEDPAYREYFLRMVRRVLAEQLTQAFLDERYRHYAALAGTMGVPDLAFLPRLKEFVDRRRDFFRATTEAWLNAESRTPARVDAGVRDDAGRSRLSWVRVPGAAPFEMLAREVTAADFAAFSAFSGVRMPRQPEWFAEPSHPVMNVTWDEAAGFCAWAGGRLPAEAEWLHAARGGAEGREYPWGDAFAGEANLQGQRGADRWAFTAPAGSFAPNGYGLFDMVGNVWEWTSEPFKQKEWPGYEMRVVRGGSWDNLPERARLNARAGLSRNGRHNLYVGFRCAR